MKEKLKALDELIGMCESAMAKPYKSKRMAVVIKPEEDSEELSEDSIDKKSKISEILDAMDEDELIRLYSKLEG